MNLYFKWMLWRYKLRANRLINRELKELSIEPDILKEAIAYVLNSGGKRIRACLTFIAGDIFKSPTVANDIVALTLETIHAASLVHDDLPYIDDAMMRRDALCCHVKYGNDIGIITGSAMQALTAYFMTQEIPNLSPKLQKMMIIELIQLTGSSGLVGGEALDIMLMDTPLSLQQLEKIYHLKTGALITAAVKLPAIAANQHETQKCDAMVNYAQCLGLAYQIKDDILDYEEELNTTGNCTKVTYPQLSGLGKAQEKVQELCDSALDGIKNAGIKNKILYDLAQYLSCRSH